MKFPFDFAELGNTRSLVHTRVGRIAAKHGRILTESRQTEKHNPQHAKKVHATVRRSNCELVMCGMRLRNDDSQRTPPQRNSHWRLTDILAIGVDIKRMFSFKPGTRSL